MERQALFDLVARGLLTQNQKSTVDEYSEECCYRGPGGLKCAAGFAIPDDLYDKGMEERNITDVLQRHEALALYIGRENMDMMQRLQDLHDQQEPYEWRNGLRVLAHRYDLHDDVTRE